MLAPSGLALLRCWRVTRAASRWRREKPRAQREEPRLQKTLYFSFSHVFVWLIAGRRQTLLSGDKVKENHTAAALTMAVAFCCAVPVFNEPFESWDRFYFDFCDRCVCENLLKPAESLFVLLIVLPVSFLLARSCFSSSKHNNMQISWLGVSLSAALFCSNESGGKNKNSWFLPFLPAQLLLPVFTPTSVKMIYLQKR